MYFFNILVHNFSKDSIVKSVIRSRSNAIRNVRLSSEVLNAMLTCRLLYNCVVCHAIWRINVATAGDAVSRLL